MGTRMDPHHAAFTLCLPLVHLAGCHDTSREHVGNDTAPRRTRGGPGVTPKPPLTCMFLTVDLTGQLSNPSSELVRMLRGDRSNVTRVAGHKGNERRTRKKYVRLSDQARAEVVQRHLAGSSQRELASLYGVHRTTIADILQHA